MTEYIMVHTAFDNKEEAENVTNVLLEGRLASCCQMMTIVSSYHWKGNIEHTEEYLLQIKTKRNLFEEVRDTIIKLHSYETPEISMYAIEGGSIQFLDWIEAETK